MAKQNTNNVLKMTTSLIVILILIALVSLSRSSAAALSGGGGFLECKDADVAPAVARRAAKFPALRHCGGGGWLLAKLPKTGVVPPSGPSRRTNGDHY